MDNNIIKELNNIDTALVNLNINFQSEKIEEIRRDINELRKQIVDFEFPKSNEWHRYILKYGGKADNLIYNSFLKTMDIDQYIDEFIDRDPDFYFNLNDILDELTNYEAFTFGQKYYDIPTDAYCYYYILNGLKSFASKQDILTSEYFRDYCRYIYNVRVKHEWDKLLANNFEGLEDNEFAALFRKIATKEYWKQFE